MLTTKDLENIGEYLKDIFVTKDEFKAIDGKMDRLQTSVDGIAKIGLDYNP